jgi:hypothetical protein
MFNKFYETYRGIECNFVERTVALENWCPHAYKVLDSGDEPCKNIEYIPDVYTFRVFGHDTIIDDETQEETI